MKNIDFRSDTVTKPTDEMRESMKNAVVGDDVYEDDITTNKLQEYAKNLLGKEAALFVPSGTFSNQLALFTHIKRGQEVILSEECHIIEHEAGAGAIIAGAQFRTLPSFHGKMDIEKIEMTIRKTEDIHYPKTALICLENAFSDGTVLDLEYMKQVFDISRKYNIKVHLDGARFFNAVTALSCKAEDLAKYADSISCCLSKGLCAPIGSLLVGSKEFIDEARKKRKIMGGGMRQTGVLAAPGLIALKKMRLRLIEDHDNAKYLSDKLSTLPVSVMKDNLDINMVFFKVTDEKALKIFEPERLKEKGILINPVENGLFRFVTHYWINKEDIDYTVRCLHEMYGKEK